MQKINHQADNRPAAAARSAFVLSLVCLASPSVWAYRGLPMASDGMAVTLAVAAVVLLLLDGRKKQFEERAFFGTLSGVAAALMVSGLLMGSGSRYGVEDNDAQPMVETAPTAAYVADTQASDLALRLGDRTADGDEGVELPGTKTRIKVSCHQGVSVHLLSKQALPKLLIVKIMATDMEPSTRVTEDTVDKSNDEGFEHISKMDTRCDSMDQAHIVLEGLKFDLATVKPPDDGKVWISLTKK